MYFIHITYYCYISFQGIHLFIYLLSIISVIAIIKGCPEPYTVLYIKYRTSTVSLAPTLGHPLL